MRSNWWGVLVGHGKLCFCAFQIFLQFTTLAMTLLYLHLIWLLATKVGFNICISLLCWKINNLPLPLKYLWFV
jgi:hypothetical protein